MKRLFTLLFLIVLYPAQAQLSADTFDFWVGSWDLTWTNAQGQTETGKNEIVRILDGKVIQENFEAGPGSLQGYKGTSISVFNPQNGTWYQTWMDNQGGNINLTGEVIEGKKIFKTAEVVRNGQKAMSRMVFYDFTADSFTWEWEATTDGGKTWKLNWRINYQRAQ